MTEEISPLEDHGWWMERLRKDAKSKLEERIMTEQPTALRLADALEGHAKQAWTREEAAAELRRLHHENERLKAGVLMEREACARIAETKGGYTHLPTGVQICGSKAAAAIRARSKT
jgi:hypothetical protein